MLHLHIIRSLWVSSSYINTTLHFRPHYQFLSHQPVHRMLSQGRPEGIKWFGSLEKKEKKYHISCLFSRLDQMKGSVSVSDSQPETQRLCEAGRRSHLHVGLFWSFRMAGALFSQSTVCLEDSTLGTLYGNLCYRPQEILSHFWNSVQLSQQQKSNSTAAWISHRRVLFFYGEHKANTQDVLCWGYSYCILYAGVLCHLSLKVAYKVILYNEMVNLCCLPFYRELSLSNPLTSLTCNTQHVQAMHLAHRTQNCRTKYTERVPEGHSETSYSAKAGLWPGELWAFSSMQIPQTSWIPVPIQWNHMVKPALWWKWFSKNPGVSCVPPSACCLLHDHSTLWRRGWAHLMSKHIRDTNRVHPKEELFWCI